MNSPWIWRIIMAFVIVLFALAAISTYLDSKDPQKAVVRVTVSLDYYVSGGHTETVRLYIDGK